MKKILKTLSVFLAASVMTFTLASCGSGTPDLNGTWKFEDGSKITFNTKKGTYESKGTNNSISGTFLLMNGGILSTTGENGETEKFMIALSDTGFDMDFNGESISLVGKKVDSVKKLNGTYKSVNTVTPMKFNFKKSSGKMTVTSVGADKNSDQIAVFDYKIENSYAILFTSGAYAFGEPVELSYPDSKHVSIDGEILSR